MRIAARERSGWIDGFGGSRPSLLGGMVVSLVSVALATAAIYGLKPVAPVVSLSVVYLPAVAVVAVFCGIWLGILTSLLSAAAFNFFHLPPVGRFTIADPRNWVALAAFTTIAAIVSTIANVARERAEEAERRSREADLAAELARDLLAGADTRTALQIAAGRIARALNAPSVSLELGAVGGRADSRAVGVHDAAGRQTATLLVPDGLPRTAMERIDNQIAPSLGALIALALERDAAQAEAVETAALRRSDELKTALLRATSHDLRTPVTAILTAAHAMRTEAVTDQERAELTAAMVEEGERLSALIDKLLDLSRLQSGRAEPRREWTTLEEVVLAARDGLSEPIELRLSAEAGLPAIRVDAAQLERAFANLLENAWRYSARRPVSVHLRGEGTRVIARVVDQGPGIPRPEQSRIFEPFYRGARNGNGGWGGSGLGLAIARGFVEANGGTISVDSLPGQGASFVISFDRRLEAG